MKKLLTIIVSLAILITLSVPVFASISSFNPEQNKNVKDLWNSSFSREASGRKGKYDKSQDVIKPFYADYRYGIREVKKGSGYSKVVKGTTISDNAAKKIMKAMESGNDIRECK